MILEKEYTQILGSGYELPAKKVSNFDICQMMNTSEEFIIDRTGIENRFHVNEDQSLEDISVPAIMKAIHMAGIDKSEIDMFIVNTISPDHHDPSEACYLQSKVGLKEIPCFDIKAQCSGFIYALDIANQYLKSNKELKILVLCGEVLSKRMDVSDDGRNLSILLGDGAAAFVLARGPQSEKGLIDVITRANGGYFDLLSTKSPGTKGKKFLSQNDIDNSFHEFRLNGKAMFPHAVKCFVDITLEILAKHELFLEDIDVLIPHQPNLRILEAVEDALKLSEGKMIKTVQTLGNMASASLPVTISMAQDNGWVKEGQLALFVTYGSGATWGAALYQY